MVEAVAGIWNSIVEWFSLHNMGSTIDFVFAYYAIKLGYAAIMSIAVFGLCMLLRVLWSKDKLGMRIICWSPMLLIPFLEKLRAYYEFRPLLRVMYRWYLLCGEVKITKWLYLMIGITLTAYLLVRRKKLYGVLKCARKQELFGETVYVIPFDTGAFSMGIVHPRIVIPENMLEACSDEELKGVILHEKIHIKHGHIIMLTLWNILQVLYWINPFLHIGMKYLKEDIELNCDMAVLERKEMTTVQYGDLLLKQVMMMHIAPQGDVAPLSGQNGYASIHRRITEIAHFKDMGRKVKVFLCITTMVMVILAAAVLKQNSYPRTMLMTNILITNDKYEILLDMDESELKDVIEIREDYLVVDTDALRKLLPKEGMDTEWLFVCFGGFMKFPGVGGGGDAVIIDVPMATGRIEVPYISVRNDPISNILKWI